MYEELSLLDKLLEAFALVFTDLNWKVEKNELLFDDETVRVKYDGKEFVIFNFKDEKFEPFADDALGAAYQLAYIAVDSRLEMVLDEILDEDDDDDTEEDEEPEVGKDYRAGNLKK